MVDQADLRPVSMEFASASAEIIEQAAERESRMDEAAFRRLYKETAQPLFAYLLRVSGQRDLAEDLLQEAYCRLLTAKLPIMDESGQRSYLFRVATNLLHDYWRRHKEYPLPENPSEAPLRATHLDLQIETREAFQHLKRRERSLLWLAYVEGLSHKEIADSTGLKAGSIRLLLFRARRKLTNILHRSRGLEPKEKI